MVVRAQPLQFHDFEKASLELLLGPGVTTDYLFNYLTDLGAKSIVVEPRYVDRHYLEEFASYYSKSFEPPPHDCQRLHFFGCLSATDLRSTIVSAFDLPPEKSAEVVAGLNAQYQGFVVRRPLAGARVGRTVLRTYPVAGRRHFEVQRDYKVRLAGLRLVVSGIAFQNQDRGAAVCASTALWSALQKIAHVAGHRTPTPHAITVAAGSPFPASEGLTHIGMATALWKLGYLADLFVPNNRALFRALICACLQSGLPVVLILNQGPGQVGHAVTLTGYSEPGHVAPVTLHTHMRISVPMLAGGLSTLYVHDDNLGPHAHYELEDTTDPHTGSDRLVIHRGDRKHPRPITWPVDTWTVGGALVPKPEKLRLSVQKLLEKALFLSSLLQRVLHGTFDTTRLNYGAYFGTGTGVKETLVSGSFDPPTRQRFLLECSLPRHVGVVSASLDGSKFCELVIDVTEVDRKPGEPSPLGLVAHAVHHQHPVGALLAKVAVSLGVPIVFGVSP